MDDAITEVEDEDFLEAEVIRPEVHDIIQDVAIEILEHYDNKVRRRQLSEVGLGVKTQ